MMTTLERKLEDLQNNLRADSLVYVADKELELRKELERLLELEEIQWAQRAHQLWLISGDKNTKYFHTMGTGEFRTITKLMDDSGVWLEEQGDLEKFVVSYYRKVYSMQEEKSMEDIIEALNDLSFPCITVERSLDLMKEVDEEEIRSAIFEMKPFKVPGPDGLPAVFFQKLWDVIRVDIVRMIKSFFSKGFLLKELNSTNIALIPKVDNPVVLKGFRPISLCNVCHKIISKILANRF